MSERRKYGLQCSPITEQIHIGRINKAGNAFLDKEDVTQDFIRAVIDKYQGQEVTITDKVTKESWTISVKQEANG